MVGFNQDPVFAKIRSFAASSLETIEHANVLGCLGRSDGDAQLREVFISDEPQNLHDNTTQNRHFGLDCDFVAVLIFCFSHIECR